MHEMSLAIITEIQVRPSFHCFERKMLGADAYPLDFTGAMLEDFQAYHPDLKHVIKIAEGVSCWPLMARDPLSSWTHGKIVLVGDAAHPVSYLHWIGQQNKSPQCKGHI